MERKKSEEYKPLTHEEMVQEVYQRLSKLPAKKQADIVEKWKEILEKDD